MKEHDQWLVTQDKKPVVPSEGWQHPVNLLTFTEAKDKAEQLGGTVAFCFIESGPFVGFDLDDVKEGGEFTEEARTIVQRLESYTEVSSSGTGIHVIVEGDHSAVISSGGGSELCSNSFAVPACSVTDATKVHGPVTSASRNIHPDGPPLATRSRRSGGTYRRSRPD